MLGVSAGIMLGVGAWALTVGGAGAAGQGSDGRTVVEGPRQQQQEPLLPGDCTPAGSDGGVICRGTGGPPADQKQPGEMISPEQAEQNLKKMQDRLPEG